VMERGARCGVLCGTGRVRSLSFVCIARCRLSSPSSSSTADSPARRSVARRELFVTVEVEVFTAAARPLRAHAGVTAVALRDATWTAATGTTATETESMQSWKMMYALCSRAEI
jgi:hypothetical protein